MSEKQTCVKDWRECFPDDVLFDGHRLSEAGAVISFQVSLSGDRVEADVRDGNKVCRVYVRHAPVSYTEEWKPTCFSCGCGSKRAFRFFDGDFRYSRHYICPHEAAVMYYWEGTHGPWRFDEPEEMRLERLRQERINKILTERKLMKERDEKITARAVDFFPDEGRDGTFFDVRTALKWETTNKFALYRAKELLENGHVTNLTIELNYGAQGRQELHASCTVSDETESKNAKAALSEEHISSQCSCSWYSMRTGLCEHELVLLHHLREYIRKENPGNATDLAAEMFFSAMDSAVTEAVTESAEIERVKSVSLEPLVTVDGEDTYLSFRISKTGAKPLIIKSPRELVNKYAEGGTYSPSKTVSIDFSAEDFTEDSLPWLGFIQRRVSENDSVNDSLSSRYYYTSVSLKSRDKLEGAMLDRFYDLAEGKTCPIQDKGTKYNGELQIGHSDASVVLRTGIIRSADGKPVGMEVLGKMPRLKKGSSDSYILTRTRLSKLSREDEQTLRPFKAASDESGNIFFRVGADKLAEFCYRIMPRLLESPCIDIEDLASDEIASILPPEPVFRFRMDLDRENGLMLCDAEVSYGGDYVRILEGASGEYFDQAQEVRVERALSNYFDEYDKARNRYIAPLTEDALYRLLTDGVSELSHFGSVEGSSEFQKASVRPMPQIHVGVSVDSGLLDISVISKDIDPLELMSVLESYKLKKKYHRLRSGAFLSIAGSSQLAAIERIADGMSISAEDMIKGTTRVPAYRALYLDSLLEERDELALDRDRKYRAIIKNFKTIRDADYEVPAAQSEILRPYQVYGFKWLTTLSTAGFGGILADEMGLGKTLQSISMLTYLRQNGDSRPFLIVCPASLIYNWQEEFERFSPELDVRVIAGTAAARKKTLSGVTSDTPVVCVTSYDLLRQDISIYKELRFSTMIIDEAQYIKNQKAAMTKAVKVIRAEHRFALTGTPIENRLAELWSIFDYLMPGFLYTYPEFSKRFESPITRQKDEEATARLKSMVRPFILRRLKEDVLSDLPPKLEEVRYTRFGDEQRKIYDGQVVRMKKMLTESTGSPEDRIKIFAELMRIRQICCDPSLLLEGYEGGSAKRAACSELIESAINGGHRILLFSQFTSMLALIEEDLKSAGVEYYKITGATPKEQRVRLVRAFNEGSVPVFIISLKAGGTGLNLTGADVVIHYDPWWNLAAQNQATDRAHRIGQKKQVTVYRLIVRDTIEERILAMQEMKKDLADAILSGESSSISSLSNEELLALLD